MCSPGPLHVYSGAIKKGSLTIIRAFKPGHAGRTSGFLKLFLCGRLYTCVCVCVCVCVFACVSAPRLLITGGVMWCDVDPYDWLNKFYGFCMAAVVDIVSGRGVSIQPVKPFSNFQCHMYCTMGYFQRSFFQIFQRAPPHQNNTLQK